MTFTAHWSKKSSSGGSGGGSSYDGYYVKYHNGDEVEKDKNYYPGREVTVKDNMFTIPEGMIFIGWSSEENGDVEYTAGDIFKMPSENVDLYAVWERLDFLIHNAYISGYPDGTMAPEKNITRGEAAQIFYSLMGTKDTDGINIFTDIDEDAWYKDAVNTLAETGVIAGVGNNIFEPERNVTRAEFTAMAMRFAGKKSECENIFSDVYPYEWFYNDIISSIKAGWITGYPDGTFRPNNSITRAEAITIVNSMLERNADKGYIDLNSDSLISFTDVDVNFWGYYQIMEAANSHYYQKNDDFEIWTGLIK